MGFRPRFFSESQNTVLKLSSTYLGNRFWRKWALNSSSSERFCHVFAKLFQGHLHRNQTMPATRLMLSWVTVLMKSKCKSVWLHQGSANMTEFGSVSASVDSRKAWETWAGQTLKRHMHTTFSPNIKSCPENFFFDSEFLLFYLFVRYSFIIYFFLVTHLRLGISLSAMGGMSVYSFMRAVCKVKFHTHYMLQHLHKSCALALLSCIFLSQWIFLFLVLSWAIFC